jgi:tRNA (mo5U34)-methyltransferase
MSGGLGSGGLRGEIDSIAWYHTIELAPGVVTPGWFDHRPIVNAVPLPPSLAGKRCLDVGTFNGFWAFEMERRGAEEVVGIDVLDPRRWDWPSGSPEPVIAEVGDRLAGGAGFEIARRALGSSVMRRDLSIYDLDPDELGRFDVVYLGSLLVHLRDPVRALERVRAVCAGSLIVVDGVDLPLSLWRPRRPAARLDARERPWWWYPNLAGLARLVEVAGFELARPPRRLFLPPGRAWPRRRFDPRLLRSATGRYALTVGWLGDPHGMVLARPRHG